MILNRSNVARGLGRNLPELTFVAVWAVLAAVGCGGDSGTVPMPNTAAGTGAGTTPGAAGIGTVAGIGAAAGVGAVAGSTVGAAGSGVAGGAAGTGASSGAAPTLQMVYDMIYVTNCAICHAMKPTPTANGNLGDIRGSKDAFYTAFVNKPAIGAQCGGKGMYIVPGQPAQSLLIQKITADTPPCGGTRMPPTGPLQPADIQLVTDWVMAGAPNN